MRSSPLRTYAPALAGYWQGLRTQRHDALLTLAHLQVRQQLQVTDMAPEARRPMMLCQAGPLKPYLAFVTPEVGATCRRASASSRSTTRRSRACERRSRANTHDSTASAAELIAKLVSDSFRSGAPGPPAAATRNACRTKQACTQHARRLIHSREPY